MGNSVGRLGRRHAGRRHDELHRQDPLPRRRREPSPRRAFHACRSRRDRLSRHHHRSDDLHEAVDAGHSVRGHRRGAMFEYACHEGNYGMEGILSGAREEERAAAGQGEVACGCIECSSAQSRLLTARSARRRLGASFVRGRVRRQQADPVARDRRQGGVDQPAHLDSHRRQEAPTGRPSAG